MVEVLTAFGVSAKELFAYNRDYYVFDQKQRLDREMLRLEMQIKRFDLFRDDIRDLVQLTTSKMEMYHMVGALCLEFIVNIYTEGAEMAWVAPAPPFIKACYAMSLASAFCYIILAVWLSMHASVSAHSFGVRLLTRFVRLPIPGSQQVNSLNVRLADFEQQGINNALRVPFIGPAQKWQQRQGPDPSAECESDLGEEERGEDDDMRQQDLLGTGEVGINDHDLTDAATRLPGHHVQLFRRLQAKWQCYDTYARVCMSLGAYQLLAGISYFLIIATMQHYKSMTCGYAVITVFVVSQLVLAMLDIGRKMMFSIVALQLFGAIPIYLSAYAFSSTIFDNMEQHHRNPYAASPVVFFLVALWHEGLLHFAWPSNDGMSLPRRFRTVLFIDVFSVADEALKSNDAPAGERSQKEALGVAEGANYSEEQVMAAEEAVFDAEAALRRWQAVPAGTLEAKAQAKDLAKLRDELIVFRRMLNSEAARLAQKMGDQEALALLEIDKRPWVELSEDEQGQDPFKGSLLGPFKHATEGSSYYYDLEAREFVWIVEEGREVLTVEELRELVRTAGQQVIAVLGPGGGNADDVYHPGDAVDGPDEATDRPAQKRSFAPGGSIFTPQRLPWKAVKLVTRVLVFAWAFLGLMFLIELCLDPEPRWDTLVVASHHRRLAGTWDFQTLGVLPHGALRPSSLSCRDSPEVLLVGDGGALRVTASRDILRTWTSESLSEAVLPSGAVALCGHAPASEGQAAGCLMGAPREEGIALWSSDTGLAAARLLRVDGAAWRSLAGAVLPCAAVEGMLPQGGNIWCLLLVGWDGSELPVAAVPLSSGPGSLPAEGASIVPVFDAPLNAFRDAPQASGAVVSLHVEPRRGRLWAVLAGGDVQSWELLGAFPRGLGRWSLDLGGARAMAVCEDPLREELLVASAGAMGSVVATPRLLASPLPGPLVLPPKAASW